MIASVGEMPPAMNWAALSRSISAHRKGRSSCALESIGRGRGRNDPGRGRNLTIIKPERAEEFLAGVQLAFAAN